MFPAEWDAEPYLGQVGYLPHPYPRRAYATMIWRLDFEVGLLLDLLDELGLAEDTIVIFSSDNGPTYAGGVDYEFFDSSGGLRGRKGNLYEGGVRVPMIARWPGRIAAGSTSDHVSGFQDVLATVLELTGSRFEDRTDGISFAPTLLGQEDQAQHDYLYWEHGGKQAVLLVEDDWKAVRAGLKKGDRSIEVYRLESDPREHENVAAEHPELVEQLEKLFAAARTPSEQFPLPGIDER
jgi:arylsulfatase